MSSTGRHSLSAANALCVAGVRWPGGHVRPGNGGEMKRTRRQPTDEAGVVESPPAAADANDASVNDAAVNAAQSSSNPSSSNTATGNLANTDDPDEPIGLARKFPELALIDPINIDVVRKQSGHLIWQLALPDNPLFDNPLMLHGPSLTADRREQPEKNIVFLAMLFGKIADFEIEPEPRIGFKSEARRLSLMRNRRQLEEITDNDNLQSSKR